MLASCWTLWRWALAAAGHLQQRTRAWAHDLLATGSTSTSGGGGEGGGPVGTLQATLEWWWVVPGRRRAALLALATVSLTAQALLLSHVASQGATGHEPAHSHHPHAVLLPSWQQQHQKSSSSAQQQQQRGGRERTGAVEGGGGGVGVGVGVGGVVEGEAEWGNPLPELLQDEWTMAHHLSVTLLFELTKLLISTLLLLFSLRDGMGGGGGGSAGPSGPAASVVAGGRRLGQLAWRWEESRHYLMPALLYLVNDNLLFAILTLIDPATFEILGNMRILTTSLFYRLVFRRRRHMNQVQWASLVLLCVGTATSQLVTCGEEIISAIPISGFLLALLYCFISGFAGVYLEYLMKRPTEQFNSFHFQNVQLYAYGVLLNAVPLYTYYYKEVNSMGIMMLAGSDVLTAITVLNHALTGLVMGAIVKYLDNIARVYAHSISMIITILVSSLWLSRVPSIQLVLGSVIVLISLHLYHLPHDEYAALKAHPRADHDRDHDRHSVVDYDMTATAAAAHGLPVKREALAPALHDL